MIIDNLANLKIDQNHLNKGKIQGITRDETKKIGKKTIKFSLIIFHT